MLRKCAISLAVIGALSATHANALGLGEVKVSSALNQPLEAEIDLLQLRGLDASQIVTSLAETDDFYLAGVKPSAILSDLSFKLDISGGNGRIILTTSEPIREPFLNFLIEVNWPSGRLVREYTVLLDPPVFTTEAVAPIGRLVAPVAQAGQKTKPAVGGSRSSAAQLTAGPGQYHVKNDDTLWQVALSTRPDKSISPQQMMLAIQHANPDAFFNNNINRLKSGVVLTIPSKEQLLNVNAKESLQEVKRQNSSWKGGPASAAKLNSARLDTAAKEMVAGSAVAEEAAQLRIVSKAPEETPVVPEPSTTVASETSEASSAKEQTVAAELLAKNEELEEQLVVTLEGMDKIERDNAEMFERLDRLTEQMESMQRLVELKDQQLAQLQGQAAQKQAAAVTPVADEQSVAGALPLGMIGGIAAAALALLVGLFAMMRRRRQSEDADEALVTLNEDEMVVDVESLDEPQTKAEASVATDAVAGSTAGEFDAVDDVALEEDSADPFNMATDSEVVDSEFDAISDLELDSALGDDLDMDLQLDEPIVDGAEMEAFSNALLSDDEYDLSTGLDEGGVEDVAGAAVAGESDDSLDSDLDLLLSESGSEFDEKSIEAKVGGSADEDFSSDLDDLLAESDAGESLLAGDDAGVDGDAGAPAELDAELEDDFSSELDDLLAEDAAGSLVSEIEVGVDAGSATVAELDAGLDDGFSSELDDLLAEDAAESLLDGVEAGAEADSAAVTELDAELGDEFGFELDDLLAEDAAESLLDGVEAGAEVDSAAVAGLDAELGDEFGFDLADADAEVMLDEVDADEPQGSLLESQDAQDASAVDSIAADAGEDDIPDDSVLDALLDSAEIEGGEFEAVLADAEDTAGVDALDVDFGNDPDIADAVETELDHPVVGELPGQELDVADDKVEFETEFEQERESEDAEFLAGLTLEGEPADALSIDQELSGREVPVALRLDDAAGDALEPDVAEVEAVDNESTTAPLSFLSLEDDLDEAGDAELEAELEQMLEAEDNALALQEADLEGGEINYLDSADEVGTKIDLARAYIDMEDHAGARDILKEVVAEGAAEQISEANQLMESLNS